MAGELNLTYTLHRPMYQALPTPQQAYLLLEAQPVDTTPSVVANKPVNFCLVLDRSGSMAGEKLQQMKIAARTVVERLSPLDMLSIVIFDETADLIVPASQVSDYEVVKKKIDSVLERGGTHMSVGMIAGLEELKRGLSPERVSRMLLLTDGQTWEDQDECQALADQCRAAGIPINVFGLGLGEEGNWDPRLLEELAQRSGGEWTIIDSPEKVVSAFAATLQSMQGTSITNAYLTMRMIEGVSPRAVWRVSPLISRLGHMAVATHDVQIFLGDVQSPGQSILADLLFPAKPVGNYRLIQADITYDVPGTGLNAQKCTIDIVVPFGEDEILFKQLNPRVLNIVERVTAHRLQTQALDEAAMGDPVKATQKLRAAATRLLELGENSLADQAAQQARNLEQNGQIDLATAQKMRFATKRLTESQ